MEIPVDFSALFTKYLQNSCSPEEMEQLMGLIESESFRESALERIGQVIGGEPEIISPDEQLRKRLEQRLAAIFKEDQITPVRNISRIQIIRRWTVAASVSILLGGGSYYFISRENNKAEISNTGKKQANDIPAPAANKAILTLAGGERIVLDSAKTGELAAQGKVSIVKLSDGKITYNGDAQPKSEMIYNVLTNPRGSKVISLALSDGTMVWLNAASSIKYPAAFGGNERKVEITGEAYFEVKHDEKFPFVVLANGTRIKDIGTAFNINAYTDEPSVKTTLVSGAVTVSLELTQSVDLKPGQQAISARNEINMQTANIEEALAWKNGLFSFDKADIYTVMRQLSRWYNVEVRFEDKPENMIFQGEIGRNLSLAQVLKGFEQIHVHFRIEDNNRIVILPGEQGNAK